MKTGTMMATGNNKQVFDVTKPGKSAPSSTSRPVIVNHGPMLKDPMVAQSSKDEPKEEAKAPAKNISVSLGEKVITPLESAKTEESADTTETEAPKPDAVEKEAPPPETMSSALDEPLTSDASKKKKSEADDIAHQAELEKLVEEKKYFLPIGQVSHRRNRRWMVGFVVLTLILVPAVYLALDAKLVDIDVKLPYDFIKS